MRRQYGRRSFEARSSRPRRQRPAHKGLGAAGRKTYGDVWPPDGGLRLHRSATARRTNFAGVARSRRRLRQHAAGKVAEIEVAAGKGEVASRAEAMCRTPCRRRRHPHSPDGHRLRKFAPDSMLEEAGFEPSVPDRGQPFSRRETSSIPYPLTTRSEIVHQAKAAERGTKNPVPAAAVAALSRRRGSKSARADEA